MVRIGPRFARLETVVDNPAQLMALRADPESIAPERAVVFEVQGSVKDFYAQASALGLEYLGEVEEEFDPDADFYDRDEPAEQISGRIYLAMPDIRALRELLGLWRIYRQGRRMPAGGGPWRELFDHLIDVRPWGPQDRISDEVVQLWEEDLTQNPGEAVRLEIELWFHEQLDRRDAAFGRVQAEVVAAGGTVIHHAVIGDIRYDAVLADVPAAHVRRLIDHRDINLLRADDVMFLRPQSVVRYPLTDEFAGENNPSPPAAVNHTSQDPLAALLDGLPIQNHVRLVNRLSVDDPDGLDPLYEVDRREHGTEMASLIIHGDLNESEAPIRRPLYVRPVLRPYANGDERTPPDRLLVDVIYRAVRRLKEGDGQDGAVAPSVVVVNLSLGDEKRPFARNLSPLGRLLDYLSHRYAILFLVSAGNVLSRLRVPDFDNLIAFEAATPEERERAILLAMNANKSQRTLLCPAEALNVLTIGAANSGSAFTGALPANRFDPFTDADLPNFASAMGLGFKRSVKPELLFDGGRTPVIVVGSGGGVELAPVRAGAAQFGVKAARPRMGSTSYEDFTWGTSVATALATHAAHRIAEVLLDADGGSNHADVDPSFLALVVKALLVHGARWSEKGELLDEIFEPQGKGSYMPRRDDITRLLGYGVPDIERVLDCSANRATLLGWGTISAEKPLLYRIPIPDDLAGMRAPRAATVTLAWFSPVNAKHKGYRMAALDVSAGSNEKYWIVDERDPYQPTDKAVVRGTVFHEHRRGESAKVFVEDGHLLLRVSCRAGAGDLDGVVPYAIAVSFEAGIETGIPVYDFVRTRLQPQVQANVVGAA